MDVQRLSTIALCKNGANAKQQTVLGSYLDIHPDWKAFMEAFGLRMDGNLKESSVKVAQMGNTEKKIPAATNTTANSQLSDVSDCASDVDKTNKIENKSPPKGDEIRAQNGDGVALSNDDEFNPDENDKVVKIACKEAGRGGSCETKFSGQQQAAEPSPGANSVSPDHDAAVVRFPLGQGWAKFWYPDNTTSPAITKADVQSAPAALVRPRIGPSRAADQQRRTAQSRQPDPLVCMERYHLVVVEKDFSITIQEVGLRPHGLETTEVAREAAATNKPPRPRARKVTFNLDAPAREGRLRRSWARVSAAARRMFRRCRCCLRQR